MLSLFVRTLWATLCILSVSALPVDLSKISNDTEVKKIRSAAGMVTIDAEFNSSMFYWYFPPVNESLETNEDTPMIMWIQGGPGASGFIGNFFEVGPLDLINNTTLARRNVTWANNYHMVFVDSPVGTGYSYTDSANGYANSTEDDVNKQLYTFLTKFYDDIEPELRANPLFLVGESYAGHYIPALGKYLFEHPIEGTNFAGAAIGDGLTFPAFQVAAKPDVAYYFGLIGPDRIEEARRLGQEGKRLALQEKWVEASHARDQLENLMSEMSGGLNLYDIRTTDDYGWQDERLDYFLNLPEVKEALHVPASRSFGTEDAVGEHMSADIMKPMVHCLPPLLNANITVMLFEGEMDSKDGLLSTEAWIPEMIWDGMDEYAMSPRHVWKGTDVSLLLIY
ncbi:Vitellogenic carboxypeptidase, putative [Perkinsus marinus ATCC 50983]|uniref:Carboxypeptidase n=1 Tax=Perkinsus marinus (strain ATCC 50983 / TXsc) TaxID=423536 RepID=C5KXP2_PERM5|nr:Vitellogenic carboxypeptidase, putative [Perkinsus marinus ATCC 50983]EER10766.1 Vitellogenic carboxypeptidase, putative [Perkinsus marinus ATCC 50983]|eukprot:XP_002778971.1 Vitellogenic carboxypeptidase, putative [Perkinsus marinus ATCC 50983]